MNPNLKDVGVVVLSAGKGRRLNCVEKPKVMLEIDGKPMVSYTVATLKKTGFDAEQICLVVGFKKEIIQEYFGDSVIYAVQEEQKGTAHAAYVGMQVLNKNIKNVLVVGGDDSAFYRSETLINLINTHRANDCVLTLLSCEVENPGGAGRVVKTAKGVEVIEKEYLTEEQKSIHEISTGTFMFDREWFETVFPNMPQLRKLGEYGLPTALAIAREQNAKFQVVKLADPNEWHGVNTQEEFELADKIKKQSA